MFRVVSPARDVLCARWMRSGPIALAVLLSPALAAARPLITIGATLGETQSEAEGSANQGPDEAYGAYVRVGLTRRFAAQLELSRIDGDPSYDVRTATLFGVLDLGKGWASRPLHGVVEPILLVGFGEAWGSSASTSTDSYGLDLVAGLGVEYRAVSGLVIGAQARLGERSMQTRAEFNPVATGTPACCVTSIDVADEGLWNGQFRSLLVTGGFAF